MGRGLVVGRTDPYGGDVAATPISPKDILATAFHLLGIDPAPESNPGLSAYVVEYIPNEDAPVVWGKIVTWIEREHGTPLRQEFYDEDGELLRRMSFSDIRLVGDRRVPHHWLMVPLDKQGHSTSVKIERIVFDAEIDPAIFTKRNLRKARR